MRRPDNSAADRRREVGLLRLKAQIGQLGVDAVALDQASESVAAFAVALVADQPDDPRRAGRWAQASHGA